MDKPLRIFIGSAAEGLPVARLVKRYLSEWADTVLWNERVFSFNKSYFETLLRSASLYDLGVLVATGDDFTRSRNKPFRAARDNVLFEFGLFLGRLGPRKVFFLREEGTKLPSDLLGISLPTFPAGAGRARNKALQNICDEIREMLAQQAGTFDLGLLPSVSLAHGYFTNFVQRTCNRLLEDGQVQVAGETVTFEDFIFTILIPDDLSSDMYDKVKAERHTRRWQPIKVDAGGLRPYDFHVDLSRHADGRIEIFDIPITLNSLHQSIQQYLSVGHIGRDHDQAMLEHREITAFASVLNELIRGNAITRNRVRTEIVDV
jgi:Predicted nucleotide-binding protein containing TIR-like domain